MSSTLRQGLAELGLLDEVPRILEAADYSAGVLADAQDFLATRLPPTDDLAIDVVVFGSYARGEASEESDVDYLIVPQSLPGEDNVRCTRELTQQVLEFIERLAKTNGVKVSKLRPGSSGVFGTIQSAVDLVERIGLEQDTNATHTRRCLLLQESQSIYRPDLHTQLLRTILARYLADYEDGIKPGAPRFLLNDLNRYWFTVAVDYQAKRWERLDLGWGIRYLKLLITRRLSYVAGVLPLLLCDGVSPASVDLLAEAYERPALARLTSLASRPDFEEVDELKRIFLGVERFLAVISDTDLRKELNEVSIKPAKGAVPIFDEMREVTTVIDEALRRIFAGSLLQERTFRYLIL